MAATARPSFLPPPTPSLPPRIRSTWSPRRRAPVYVQRLKGSSTRLGRFHELMRERGATRPFAGKIESWSYVPINDTELVAAAMRRSLGLETLA
ncbi:MAG TPA: ELM1/GtrOC1 family putative glycosyltransferase [Methyloceanibacter sp.]